ncbi:MAG TPA: amidohydrolase family protein [Methylomirabilota bacterium]|jgi:predicted TIM-barrel fold metal-dependent hydrolase|nr:amidohydrolase family protein [Methylomirabilota bacterium]
MPYAEGRVYNDADSHLMETQDWLVAYADPGMREQLRPPYFGATGRMREAIGKKRDAKYWESIDIEANLMNLKGWDALGASDPRERTRALDLLGFNCQLVFPSIALSQFWGLFGQQERNPELLYGGARALNRAMTDFCAHDKRLLPVGFVPLDVPALAEREIEEAVRLGCRGVWIPPTPPGDISPTHPMYNGVWARFQDANIPFLLHVGAAARPVPPAFINNGRPTTDFLGGGESIRAKDYLVLHTASEVFLGAMVLDGIFEQFPRLRGGCIEEGAMWVVPWLKRLDIAQETFVRTEPSLALPLRASEYVHRQLRFTPHPTEPVGWMIEQAGDDLFMFSSDYPHIEGGRNPLKRFEASMPNISEAAKERFYARNFVDLVG